MTKPDHALVREGLILGGFLVLCAISVWTVVLPALSDEPTDAETSGSPGPDAGMP